jgi:hypothetical protein
MIATAIVDTPASVAPWHHATPAHTAALFGRNRAALPAAQADLYRARAAGPADSNQLSTVERADSRTATRPRNSTTRSSYEPDVTHPLLTADNWV